MRHRRRIGTIVGRIHGVSRRRRVRLGRRNTSSTRVDRVAADGVFFHGAKSTGHAAQRSTSTDCADATIAVRVWLPKPTFTPTHRHTHTHTQSARAHTQTGTHKTQNAGKMPSASYRRHRVAATTYPLVGDERMRRFLSSLFINFDGTAVVVTAAMAVPGLVTTPTHSRFSFARRSAL